MSSQTLVYAPASFRQGPLLLAALLLAGCASTAPRPEALNTSPHPEDNRAIEQTLRAGAAPWLGTPHRWGGNTRQGVDCSGLVQALYRDLFGIPLPRTTAAQVQTGTPVARDALRPGDLVFFHTEKRTRHVGVYLCCGEFVHASSSQGVTISRLDAPYWRRAYWTARRLLTESPTALPIPPSTTRSGW